ncbi:hypothetical protein FQZ97_805850 [compost metagenome]
MHAGTARNPPPGRDGRRPGAPDSATGADRAGLRAAPPAEHPADRRGVDPARPATAGAGAAGRCAHPAQAIRPRHRGPRQPDPRDAGPAGRIERPAGQGAGIVRRVGGDAEARSAATNPRPGAARIPAHGKYTRNTAGAHRAGRHAAEHYPAGLPAVVGRVVPACPATGQGRRLRPGVDTGTTLQLGGPAHRGQPAASARPDVPADLPPGTGGRPALAHPGQPELVRAGSGAGRAGGAGAVAERR